MKVGIMTFHASHNYGSMLQAYALQQVVMSLGHECEIINFRTKRQKKFYSPFNLGLIRAVIRYPGVAYANIRKYYIFEQFIKENLKLSLDEFSSFSELERFAHGYDVYISGSDQIWNVSCYDWDKAYGLGFVKNGCKIAYAPSMGPIPDTEVVTRTDRMNILGELMKKYDSISVREYKTACIVSSITGKDVEQTLDPTLLLNSSDWMKLENRDVLIKEDYILLYSPWQNEGLYQEAIAIGEKFKTKIVVTMHYGYVHYRNNPNVIFKVATGPREFITLIRNARLVIGASFHAVAFAIIFGRQLYAYRGLEDSRVLSLLSITSLEHFAKKPETLLSEEQISDLYTEVYQKIDVVANGSRKFLIKSLQNDAG